MSLGGAASIDFKQRVKGADWWEQKLPTEADVERTVAAGHADIMLTHDAPEGGTLEVERILALNPHGWSEDELAYAASSRARVTRAFQAVQPELLAHGHMHVRGDRSEIEHAASVRRTRVLSLGCDHAPGNAVVLDLCSTSSIGVEWLPMP